MSDVGPHGTPTRSASFASITEAFPLLRTARQAERETMPRKQYEKLWELMSTYLSSDKHTIQRSIANHVEYTLAGTRFNFDTNKAYRATAHSVRDRLIESWNDTNQYFDEKKVKRVYYLSLEYLTGRSMQNTLLNMDLHGSYEEALSEMGFDLARLLEEEQDAALGNGGLGRLAACFLDSMATLDLPAWGYGIRYNYGIFRQKIRDGAQVEVPDYWLMFGNPWEIERVDVVYPVRFNGHVETVTDEEGQEHSKWTGGELVMAVAYDNPVPGFDTWNTINLRLWKAAPAREFDLQSFNSGDYFRAVEERQRAETITSVLYPSDDTMLGKELRLKQQYFFVSATLRDIIRRFKKHTGYRWEEFPDKVAIQLNDTHPAIGIPELMRILIDEEGLDWDTAWNITHGTYAYTNHTILPEAMERWSVDLVGHLLPRHLQIIFDINWFFLQEVEARFPGDVGRLSRMSIVEEGHPKMIRMANLAMVGSHCVNGVAEIHSELLRTFVVPDFAEMFPDLFCNMTNGVTPRRWINQANPGLARLITRWLDNSDAWLKQLGLLSGLRANADDPRLQDEWRAVKLENKQRLAEHVKEWVGIDIPVEGVLYDVQVKRIHEYKRQLMNCLYVIHRYQWIKQLSAAEREEVVPRVTLFGGKAAPGYDMAKRIIQLIHRVAAVVNNDPEVGDLLKVVFIPNYNVSVAEVMIPASDLSQHISTAGMEASGTSNMKFAMNGGLILGTLDGANIEIADEIGRDNMFIFGATADEVPRLRAQLHEPVRKATPSSSPSASAAASAAAPGSGSGDRQADHHHDDAPCASLQGAVSAIRRGEFGSMDEVGPILRALERRNDWYLIRHDFPAYVDAQKAVDETYRDQDVWTQMSILSTAGMGKFSTDRTISQYAEHIWKIHPCRRPEPENVGVGRTRSFPNFDPNAIATAAPLLSSDDESPVAHSDGLRSRDAVGAGGFGPDDDVSRGAEPATRLPRLGVSEAPERGTGADVPQLDGHPIRHGHGRQDRSGGGRRQKSKKRER